MNINPPNVRRTFLEIQTRFAEILLWNLRPILKTSTFGSSQRLLKRIILPSESDHPICRRSTNDCNDLAMTAFEFAYLVSG